MDITTAALSAAAGALISLIFSYLPRLRTWYAVRSEDEKKAIMGLAVLLTAIGIIASSCLNLWVFTSCDKVGIMKVIEVVIFTLIGNQTIYPITPKATDVRMLKEARG